MFAHLNTSVSAGRCSPLISQWKTRVFSFFNLRKSLMHSFNFKGVFARCVCDVWIYIFISFLKDSWWASGREFRLRGTRCWCRYWNGAAPRRACLQPPQAFKLQLAIHLTGCSFVRKRWVVKIHLDALTFHCVNTHAAWFLYFYLLLKASC